MGWNWQKLNGTKNTPDFDKQVLLLEKRGEKCYAMVGSLKSIDANGCHWQLGTNNFPDLFNFFNFDSNEKTSDDDKSFTPTHWCVVQIPED